MLIRDFGGVFPGKFFRPYVAISGASSVTTPSAVILLDTGYSRGLSLTRRIRTQVAVPSTGVALKIVQLAAILNPASPLVDSSVVDTYALPDDVVCVDVSVEDPTDATYNVLSIGFLKERALVAVLFPSASADYAIKLEKREQTNLDKLGVEAYSTDVQFVKRTILEENLDGVFHVAVRWGGVGGAQPFLRTLVQGTRTSLEGFVGSEGAHVLWDTGAPVSVIHSGFAAALGPVYTFNEGDAQIAVLEEVSLIPMQGEKLEFRNVPFLVDDAVDGGITLGSTLFGEFESIQMCTQVGARTDLRFSFKPHQLHS